MVGLNGLDGVRVMQLVLEGRNDGHETVQILRLVSLGDPVKDLRLICCHVILTTVVSRLTWYSLLVKLNIGLYAIMLQCI